MSGLFYVGPPPTGTKGAQNRLQVTNVLAGGMTTDFVQGEINDIVATKAPKTYVDTQDSAYATTGYYQTADALNIPAASKGVANGVAALDGSGKIPSAQVPPMGYGVLKGPYGLNDTFTGTTSGSTPLKIAAWDIGPTGLSFQPLVFFSAYIQVASGGRPLIEIRIGESADTTYASQDLVSRGIGRAQFNDYQPVTTFAAAANGSMSDGDQVSFDGGYDLNLTAWLINTAGTGSCVMGSALIAASSCWLARVEAP